MTEYESRPARELHPWRYFWTQHEGLAKVLTVLLAPVIPVLLVVLFLFLT